MPEVVPQRFLFRYRIPVRYESGLPRRGKRLLDLGPEHTLPGFESLEGKHGFAELRAAWNPRGIGLSVQVAGKRHPLSCDAGDVYDSDGLQLWFDTRDTKSIHRASRFCHLFCLLPAGGGKQEQEPVCKQLPVPQAREDAPVFKASDVKLASEITADGYRLEAWIPANVLHGFEPSEHPLLGFYYRVVDAELGQQVLTVEDAFPYASDPSMWGTLELLEAGSSRG